MSYTLSSTNRTVDLTGAGGFVEQINVPAGAESSVVELLMTQDGSNAGGAADRFRLERTNGGTTNTSQTPEKLSSQERASNDTGVVDWAADPTLSGSPLVVLGGLRKTAGGQYARRWWGHPRYPILSGPSAQLAIENIAGNVVTGFLVWQEGQGAGRAIRGRRPRCRGFWLHSDGASQCSGTAHFAQSPQEFLVVDRGTWPEGFRPPASAALLSGPVDQVLSAVAGSGASFVRQVGAIKSVASAGSASFVRQVGLVRSAGSAGVASLSAGLVKLVDLVASALGSASQSRVVARLRTLAAVGGSVASLGLVSLVWAPVCTFLARLRSLVGLGSARSTTVAVSASGGRATGVGTGMRAVSVRSRSRALTVLAVDCC